MSEFELRVRPSESPNGSVCFYGLAVERGGLRVESSLRAMDLEALRRSCDRPVADAVAVESRVVVESRGGVTRLVMTGTGPRASMLVDADQRQRLRDLCEQGLKVNRDLAARGRSVDHGQQSDAGARRKGRVL